MGKSAMAFTCPPKPYRALYIHELFAHILRYGNVDQSLKCEIIAFGCRLVVNT